MGVQIRLHREVEDADATELWPVYDAVFGDQPDQSAWRCSVWDRHVNRAGFRLARAYDADDLVGFGYGYTGERGQWWTDRAAEVLSAEVGDAWLGGHFELVSIGVLPQARGRGVGTELMRRLTAGLPHARWLLMTTAETDNPARRLYEREGWRVIAPGLGDEQVIMGKERPDLARAKERAHDELVHIDAAYERGEVSEADWHARVLDIVEPAYLGAATPQGQSGHSGDAARWEHARRLVLDAVERPGTFLDIGCANGLLMESVADWSRAEGVPQEPYGVDISSPLVAVARERCPQWADRIWVANASDWDPPRRFDVVRTGADYVPPGRLGVFLEHLLEKTVAPGGRLVVGTYNEERDRDTLADQLRDMGFQIGGRTARGHRHPELAYKALWIDA